MLGTAAPLEKIRETSSAAFGKQHSFKAEGRQRNFVSFGLIIVSRNFPNCETRIGKIATRNCE